ncbi:asparagine synthetase [hydrocarbon metagenome]|uniref:Asparagine synthetase n=1 Tax=hydrocarbon metagenome TaxID=938273 RepID=A0A0W8G9F2_9ZZZZ
MCGICGMFRARAASRDILSAMLGAMVHRGPDAEGVHADGEYLAGMRRLSINDVAGGGQPLFNQSRDVVLFYNGEIYNSPQLRRELAGQGVNFRTGSDGEVICHLYDTLGEALFERLDGMYACALWDASRRRLILARDIPGEKPLYYAPLPGGGIVFASEIKSLVRHPQVGRELDRQAVWDFPTFLWIPEPATILAGVRCVERGTMLVCQAGEITVRPIPNRFGPPVSIGGLPDGEAVALTRETVVQAIRSRLLSDVPVGSFLSGGLDSSIICATAVRELPELSTFTIGFEDLDDPYHGRADESAQAESLARRLGTRHTTIRVTADDFRGMLQDFCRYGDQPFGVSSGLGVLAVARAARDMGIKVLLTGDGADEAFGGYSWYFHLAGAMSAAPCAPREEAVSFQNVGIPLEERVRTLAGYPPPLRAWAWHYYAAETEKKRLFSRPAFEGTASSLRYFDPMPGGAARPEDYIRQDREFYFPFEMLRKADRMTMAASVEGRVPFAAPSVLGLAGGLRLDQMVRDGELKWVLRRAFADLLPADVVRRPKHGFNVPMDAWLAGAWRGMAEAAFAPDSALNRQGLLAGDARAVAGGLLDSPTRLNGHTIFCYIMLNAWLEEFATWK